MRSENRFIKFANPFFVCAAFAFFTIFLACGSDYERDVRAITGGDPGRGRAAILKQGCATCHTIPGIGGADGLVGPPLERIGSRVYLAGRIQNTPQNMIHWIRFPKQVDPQTAMPQMEISEQEGRDIAAYLYTLR